jgi:glycerophosphoryl diester phosphodiesterase
MSAINLSWKKGDMAVEIDVQLTADKEIVVIHDKKTGRVGDKNLSIKRSSLKELQTVDVGSKKGDQWKGERIPTLTEVLSSIPSRAKLIIEIKCGRDIISHLVSELRSSKIEVSQIEIIAFNYRVLSEMKREAPEYKMLWLLPLDYYWPAWVLKLNLKKKLIKLLKSNLDGVNVWAGEVIKKAFGEVIKDSELSVYTWTVNDVENAKYLVDIGVDGITSDRAEWLDKQLTGANS